MAHISYTKPNNFASFSDRKPIYEIHQFLLKTIEEFGGIGELNIDSDVHPKAFVEALVKEVAQRRETNPEFSMKVVSLDWDCEAEEDDGCLQKFLGVCEDFKMESLVARSLRLSPKKLYGLVKTIAGKLAKPTSESRSAFQLHMEHPISIRKVTENIDSHIKEGDMLVMLNLTIKGTGHTVTVRFWEDMVGGIALEAPAFCFAEEFFHKIENNSSREGSVD
ncbi:hypothetical protein CAEBREN_15841 [Caenorhabditis brenneri]|uniref:Uncharacterized protein n=1 Tax=Caenorhabditis brenneri TaxID=135651 RepID=G0M9L5_CAEBE|nr:hypothetical protein CAEBREN_15841 [Caenorhabditis brenneri]